MLSSDYALVQRPRPLLQQVEQAIRPFPVFAPRIFQILVENHKGFRERDAKSAGDFGETCLRFVADRQVAGR